MTTSRHNAPDNWPTLVLRVPRATNNNGASFRRALLKGLAKGQLQRK